MTKQILFLLFILLAFQAMGQQSLRHTLKTQAVLADLHRNADPDWRLAKKSCSKDRHVRKSISQRGFDEVFYLMDQKQLSMSKTKIALDAGENYHFTSVQVYELVKSFVWEIRHEFEFFAIPFVQFTPSDNPDFALRILPNPSGITRDFTGRKDLDTFRFHVHAKDLRIQAHQPDLAFIVFQKTREINRNLGRT